MEEQHRTHAAFPSGRKKFLKVKKIGTTAIMNEIPESPNMPVPVGTGNSKAETEQTNREITDTAMREPFNIYVCLFFIWSALALVLFVRKITVYQGFILLLVSW